MTRQEHLFACLSEECGEVVHIVGKILRFGANDHHPKTLDVPNIEILQAELTDLFAVVNLLEKEGFNLSLDAGKMVAKQEKVEKYIDYSTILGRVKPN